MPGQPVIVLPLPQLMPLLRFVTRLPLLHKRSTHLQAATKVRPSHGAHGQARPVLDRGDAGTTVLQPR
jgi:hypothetical protein